MSEIKSENFSLRKSDPIVHKVQPCFCCDMKHETFYNFINIWDIITFSFGITGAIMEIASGRLTSGVVLFIYIVCLMMVLIAYVIYYNRRNYGLFIHKFYSTTRLVLACIEILVVLVFFFVAIFIRLPRHLVPYRLLFVFGIVILGLLAGLNLYWSILLLKVVSRRTRLGDSPFLDRNESGQGSLVQSEDLNEKPAAILENENNESLSQIEEGDKPIGDVPESKVS